MTRNARSSAAHALRERTARARVGYAFFLTARPFFPRREPTDLESTLVKKKIETVVLSGFLTNCCVESTMRTAYEKGFNTITLTDCCATTSAEGHRGATEGTFGMFSSPMTGEEFLKKINA